MFIVIHGRFELIHAMTHLKLETVNDNMSV